MEIYLAGTPVTITVPMTDRYGNVIDVASVSYRVVDQTGLEVVPKSALSTFAASDTEAVIAISAQINTIVAVVPSAITAQQIDQFSVRESRTVELYLTLTTDGNIVLLNSTYALEPVDALVVGLNSYQTFAQAELTALDIPGMTGWAGATDKEKIAALQDARQHINQLNFWMMNSNVNWGQDTLNFVPEGTYVTPYASGGNHMFLFNGNLGLLTPAQYIKLPIRFRVALSKAQVTEADFILGGDPMADRRREGLILESIGEVKQMFRSSKALDLPVCKRALRYLSQFVSFSKRMGRG